MVFDIIDVTEEQLKEYTAVQMKMLRTAQQKKDELKYKADREMQMFTSIALTSGMKNSTLLADKRAELDAAVAYQCAIIADNLIYNLSLNVPPDGGDGDDGDESAGYIVDYSLSYNERYIIVRDYYLAIADPDERMALYAADEVAKKYLASYYSTLYNVLATYSR